MYLNVQCEGCHGTLIARIVDGVLMVAKCKACPSKPSKLPETIGHWKQNIINIAKDHRKHCASERCGCNMYMLKLMAEAAGVVFDGRDIAAFL